MRKAYTAEWLLALVMPADNAAATTGDLLELSSTRSSRRFWASVVRVFGASLVRSILQRPASVFGAAFCGFFLQFLLPLPCQPTPMPRRLRPKLRLIGRDEAGRSARNGRGNRAPWGNYV